MISFNYSLLFLSEIKFQNMKNIPVISITRRTLAEAYEDSLIAVFEKGTRFKTQYDKPEDPPSMDCTINITIEEPESDPMIHMAFQIGRAHV